MFGSSRKIRIAAGVLAVVLLLGGAWVLTHELDLSERFEEGVAGLSAPSGVTIAKTPGPGDAFADGKGPGDIIEIKSEQNDETPPLREMKMIPPRREVKEREHENPPLITVGQVDQEDLVVQKTITGQAAVPPKALTQGAVWDGINQAGGCGNCAPPDTNGDVGPNHYVQTVNSSFAIWNKTGTKLYGPAAINTIWQGFGGACQTRNDGDPVMLYDALANRWLISQFTAASPYYECIAISSTSDPTGTWYRYAFQLSTNDFPDYPKLGVWPDGYYMSVNWFTGGSSYGGPRPYVFKRTAMLAGQPATMQSTGAALGNSVNPILPADLDGATVPPTGTPGLFLGFGTQMNIYKFTVNWTTPASTTWTKSATLTPAGFTQLCGTTRNCVAQQGTSQKLDGIGDRLMNRLVYRNMGAYQSLLVSHSVRGSGTPAKPIAGMRWYDIRNPTGTPSIYQQGTYAPADSVSRWMGSIAMDKLGNIALGYSASGGALYPSIRYTARLTGDALGTMTQGENTMYAGTGYQSGVSRWGDYSNLSIDPVDGCTFWFTTEYNNSRGWAWGTKIGSFKVSGCQ